MRERKTRTLQDRKGAAPAPDQILSSCLDRTSLYRLD